MYQITKKIILLLFIINLLYLKKATFAQQPTALPFLTLKQPALIEIKEVNHTISIGTKIGMQAYIPNTEVVMVAEHWKEFIKSTGGKPKTNETGEIVARKIMLPSIAEQPLTLYAHFQQKVQDNKGTLISVITDLSNNNTQYLDSKNNPKQFEAMQNLLGSFATIEASKGIENKLKIEESNLLEIENQRQKLQTDKLTTMSEIEKHKQEIQKLEAVLITTNKDIESKNAEAAKQITVVEQLKANLQAIGNQLKEKKK